MRQHLSLTTERAVRHRPHELSLTGGPHPSFHEAAPLTHYRAGGAPQAGSLTGEALLEGLRDAAGVFYNNTATKECYDITQGVNPATADDGASPLTDQSARLVA
jgi:hypothetical protein